MQSIGDLGAAFERARAADRTLRVHREIRTHASRMDPPAMPWWDVAVPEVSGRQAVVEAAAEARAGRKEPAHRRVLSHHACCPLRRRADPPGRTATLPELGGIRRWKSACRKAGKAGFTAPRPGSSSRWDPKVLGPLLDRFGLKLVSGWSPPRRIAGALGRRGEGPDRGTACHLRSVGGAGDRLCRDDRQRAGAASRCRSRSGRGSAYDDFRDYGVKLTELAECGWRSAACRWPTTTTWARL